MPHSRESMIDELREILSNFRGRQYGGEITADTMFSADLGLASIDAVVLGEEIEAHFNRQLPFGQFLAELGRRGARDMSIGELADFLVENIPA